MIAEPHYTPQGEPHAALQNLDETWPNRYALFCLLNDVFLLDDKTAVDPSVPLNDTNVVATAMRLAALLNHGGGDRLLLGIALPGRFQQDHDPMREQAAISAVTASA